MVFVPLALLAALSNSITEKATRQVNPELSGTVGQCWRFSCLGAAFVYDMSSRIVASSARRAVKMMVNSNN